MNIFLILKLLLFLILSIFWLLKPEMGLDFKLGKPEYKLNIKNIKIYIYKMKVKFQIKIQLVLINYQQRQSHKIPLFLTTLQHLHQFIQKFIFILA